MCLESAVRIYPEFLFRHVIFHFFNGRNDFFYGWNARAVDVVNARTNLRAEIVFLKSGKNCKVSAACFKCDYVRVHVVNVFDNVVEFAVAHVCMNLGFWSYAGMYKAERRNCPVKVFCVPV